MNQCRETPGRRVRRPIQGPDGGFGYLELPEEATEDEWRAAAEEYWDSHGGKPPVARRTRAADDKDCLSRFGENEDGPATYLGVTVKEGGYLGLKVKGGQEDDSE